MRVRAYTHAERPELDEAWDEVVGGAWPAFLHHDEVCNRNWARLTTTFGPFQVYLVDEEDGRVVGWGNTIPFAWNGETAALPDGVRGVLPLGISGQDGGIAPSALSALQAVVRPDVRGARLGGALIQAMAEIAGRHRLAPLLAPVRPTWKDRYPLVSMERYVGWRRDDGLLFDPWLRLHERLGASIVGIAGSSMRVRGSVADWEEWTGMAFPESGDYIVPGALEPVTIDRDRDEGLYVEPNVWMRHELPRSGSDAHGLER